MSPRLRMTLGALAILALTVAAYAPVWQAGFVWDDDIMLNRLVQSPGGLRGIWFSTELPDYFPITSTVLWLEWRLWAGSPLGYHLANVLLHATAAVLVWRVFRRLSHRAGWFAAALFAVHPVNVESVAWITEHKNTVALVFATVGVLAWLRFEDDTEAAPPGASTNAARRAAGWYVLAVLAFALALLSKTAVAPLPVVLLALAYWRRGEVSSRDIRRTVPLFALALVLGVVTLWFQSHRAIGPAVIRTDGVASRVATAGHAVWFYLGKAAWPQGLAYIYPRTAVDPRTVVAFGPLAAVMLTGVLAWWARDRLGRGWLSAWIGFTALLVPVLGFADISFMRHALVADRWQYFALVVALAAVASLAEAWTRPLAQGRRVAGAIILAACAAVTWQRSHIFQNPDALWRATLAANPDSAVAHDEVGIALAARGDLDGAIAHYERALASLPDYELAHYNLGCALMQRGQLEAAGRHFERAVAIYPTFAEARYNLGTVWLQLQRPGEAATEFAAVLAAEPRSSRAANNLGSAFLQQGRYDEALARFRQAAELDPQNAAAHANCATLLLNSGRAEDALPHLARAAELDPSDPDVRANFGSALFILGRVDSAIAQFEKSLELRPEQPDVRARLAEAQNRRTPTAEATLTASVGTGAHL